MNVTTLIRRKRDGGALTAEEIHSLVAGYVSGDIPDYQMAALAMAICLRGMTFDETAALTEAMLRSGRTMRWEGLEGAVVDKHSTGGVGDKVSLVLAPLLACEGLHVPMISGRGLGPTGGTLDKLESIPGFRTDLSLDEAQRIAREVGCVITGATADIAPADKRLYGLRDVTATVESIPLITASIMSKKLAENLDALVLDVKFGSGAFMKTRTQARALAESLVATGRQMDVPVAALLTDMNQPLERMAGNTVEVQEALAVLRGEGPEDLTELTLRLGAEVVLLIDGGDSLAERTERLQRHLDTGAALEKFNAMVAAQGGNLRNLTPPAPMQQLTANRSGFIASINTQRLGEAIIELGGGRKRLGDAIDHSVGLQMLARLGDRVAAGEPLVRVFAARNEIGVAKRMIEEAIVIDDVKPPARELIAERIDAPSPMPKLE